MSAARSGTLEFNGEVSPVVVELCKDDDGIQTETARMTVCRDWSVASCRWKEMRRRLVYRRRCREHGEEWHVQRDLGASMLTTAFKRSRRVRWQGLHGQGGQTAWRWLAGVS
jgi:hypothetical protein